MRLLLDADASIKLTKIGLIEILASGFDVILTLVVYDEQVNFGLKNNYPDARIMKELVLEGKIVVEEVGDEYPTYDDFHLDRGETSLLKYRMCNDVDLIISDDEKFLKILNDMGFPFIPTASVILMCINRKLISKEEGLRFLDSSKFMIKDEHFYYIKSKIE
jgi:predicted nucleic acid-binding protein